jgi:uncharacterized protein with NRDE domain
MCLILVAWRGHPDYPCVIAANRDEFHARPAEPAHWWQDEPRILAGRDLSAGGTWLGLTREGRFAALTNFRGAARRDDAPSRGALVADILRSGDAVSGILDRLHEVGANYNGFNAIFSDGERLAVYESTVGSGRELAPGIYGLSNHLLDTPWPKVQNAKSALSTALKLLPDSSAALALLRDDRPAPDESLPRTGLSQEWERLVSSAFIRADDYGTRCSTIISIDRAGGASFEEWTWNPAGMEQGKVSYEFEVGQPVRNAG